jgi:hypothetical protein
MFRIFYAEKDATLYESLPTYNTGLDEILEIGKRLNTDGDIYQKSRSVVKFDMSEIRSVLSKYSADLTDCKFLLQLYTTNAKSLPAEYTITANILAQDWINGTGFQSSDPIIGNGITWNYPSSGSSWISSSQQIQVNNSSLYISGSGLGGSWLYQSGSGVFNQSFFNQSFFSQPGLGDNEGFSYRPTDLNIDVTDAVMLWISGSGGRSIDNNGFLLRFSEADELNNNVTGYIRFFSKETHTIYVPKLTMYWDNSTFTPGTLTAADLESYSVYTNVKAQYKDTEVVKVRIFSRDKYPRKSPTNLAPYQTVKYLPETTYYTVIDAATDEVIIPYDNIYNKVSCDSTSNFIHIDMNGFMPERYYRLEFKIVDGFTEQYITDSVYFKVIR